ncbi:proline-rich protein 36 [Anopheles cruzii]|uniref:proline-rich protein 36 n=1 Tax=Anopheles cruzii TaxID=68878 RepID=UPI0022EC21A3|nr:proline-rich protein 36 [Anopheles cruzii]
MSSPRAVPRLVGVAMLCLVLLAASTAGEFVFDDDLEDLIAEESNVDEELAPGSVLLPSDVFNDGKPFYVERDPSTGAIDFNHKKTGNQIEMDDERRPYESIKESYVSDKKDVIVHHSTPNFHDFLNLPKMYSPENFVSISSSYANLKYQGSNKGSNHRDQAHIVSVTAVAPTTTTAPSSSTKFYFSRPQYGRPTTSGGSTPGSSPTYTYPVTSGRPITTSTTSTPVPSTTSTTTTTVAITEEETTTGSPPKQLFTRYPYKSTIKNKYLETSEQTRKKFFLPSTLALPGPTTTTTTTTERAPSTPVRSSTYYSPSVRPQWPTTTTTTTTPAPTTTLGPSSTAPAHPVRFVDDTEHPPSSVGSKIKFTMPALKYEGSRPAPFRRVPVQPGSGGPGSSDRETGNGGSSSTYNKIELPKNPAVMSLSDIFSTLEQKKRLEAEGNRVEAVEQGTSTTPPAIVLLDDRRTTTVYGEGPKIEQSVDLSDHYVSYEVHHQPSSGRPIAFQSPQQQQPAYQVHQPNGHRPQQPAMDAAAGGQYVQYEVQQPQLNVVQFGAVPSMNSVVISPNQHSATFVLGSQQSVGGAGGVGGAVGPGGHFVGSVSQDSPAVGTAAALIAGRPPYQMGQVLDEPHDPAGAAIVGSVQVKPQDIIKTTSVRFPSESDDKYDNAPIISGTHKSEVLPPNGHSAPVRGGLGPGDMSSVVFPAAATHDLHEVSNRIVFDSAAPQPAADTLNRHEFAVAPNPHYPADLPEQLTPPSAAQDLKPRPPSAPLRPPVPSQGPPSFRYSEIHRRPATFPTDRTRPTLLPNILPQFRPNAKISHGHPPPPHLRESGTYRVPAGMFVKAGGPPPLRKPLPYHQQQFGGPNRLPTTRTRPGVSPPSRTPVSAELENRRYYRLPPAPPSPPAVIKDRVYNLQPSRLQAPPPPPPPPPPQQPAQPVEQPLDEPLEEHEFHRNPPQILKNLLRDELSGQQRPKLEPVVTLQMLQSKRRVEEGGSPANGVDLGASTAHPQVPVEAPGTRDRPVYVVYPVKSTPMKLERPGVDTIIVRGEHPPPPPPPAMVISPGTEYQNTPFSIASHFEQEPILVAKHKKVAHPHANSVKLNFPYSMEKPDPHALAHPVAVHPAPAQDLAAEYSEYNLGEEPSGGLGTGQEQDQDLISSKLQRFHSSTTDSTPIAILFALKMVAESMETD